jgi:D-psicose/D-tagatose/L-ribulose 3-epimerase
MGGPHRHPNPIGVHALVWDATWDEAGARSAISQSKAAGFDLIEILLLDPASVDVAATRRLLDEYDLAAVGAVGLSPATDVSSESADVVAAGERLMHDALAVGIDLGITHFGGVLYGALAKHASPVTERGRANSVAAVSRLCEQAGAADVRVALEVVNRYESNLLNTAEQAMAYLDEVGSRHLYVELDSYHMNIEESGMAEAIARCGDRLGYVQVGESHRGYPGTGTVDFAEFFRALHANDYRGPVTFETFSSASGPPELHSTLSIWRDVWTDPADLARHAYDFIDSGIESAALRSR